MNFSIGGDTFRNRRGFHDLKEAPNYFSVGWCGKALDCYHKVVVAQRRHGLLCNAFGKKLLYGDAFVWPQVCRRNAPCRRFVVEMLSAGGLW